ncbi:MAG TPA: tetratricopeptide repeat protein, partial [Armatimonadota bacterium]|nr:tetratricopeptide repeat protein [Armatimonadota bacterium]
AVDALNSALAADPNHVESRWALAWALVELGENGAAIAEFDKVVELAAGTKRAAEAEQAIERLRR